MRLDAPNLIRQISKRRSESEREASSPPLGGLLDETQPAQAIFILAGDGAQVGALKECAQRVLAGDELGAVQLTDGRDLGGGAGHEDLVGAQQVLAREG